MPAYLDHAATSPLLPEARAAMEPWLGSQFGNPSGSHRWARAARQAVDEARDRITALVGGVPGDVVFTGGGTEAANLAVLGSLGARRGPVVISAVEHHCVVHAAQAAERALGCEVRVVPVGSDGVVDLDALSKVLTSDVSLVSVQLANNETGVVQPFDQIAGLVRRRSPRAALHTDAVQAAPWFDLTGLARAADMVSISAHKFGGPQGVGALVFRRQLPVAPLSFGGPQERERRAGTHNVPGIVGMAAAFESTVTKRSQAAERARALRDRLLGGLLAAVPGVRETAPTALKTPGHCHVLVDGVESEALLVLLDRDGVAASAGAACASGAAEPSHVLLAMGYTRHEAAGALRLTVGHSSSAADIDLALEVVPPAVGRLRDRRLEAVV